MDIIVMQWAECLWCEGDERSILGNGLSGLQHFIPALKRHLHGSWRLHAAWGRDEPSRPAPPLTCLQMHAMAGWFVVNGFPDIALLIILGFGCILRTGEIFTLRTTDLEFSANKVRLILRNTKIGRRLGVTQETYSDDPWLVPRLRRFCLGLTRGSLLLQVTGTRFRSLWSKARIANKLPGVYTPYAIRRGGATALFQASGSYDVVSDVGRWRSLAVLRQYVNTAIAELAADHEGPLLHDLHLRRAESLHRLRP
jgi:integrase